VVLLSFALRDALPQFSSRPYWGYLVFFTFVTVGLFVSSVKGEEEEGDKESVDAAVDVIMNHSSTEETYIKRPTPYPVCSMRWGSSIESLNVLDLSVLAAYSYVASEVDFDKQLQSSFAERSQVVYFGDLNQLPRTVAVRFEDRTNPDKGTIVIAVKGTSSAKDAYADTAMYSMISVLQAFDKAFAILGPFAQSIHHVAAGQSATPHRSPHRRRDDRQIDDAS